MKITKNLLLLFLLTIKTFNSECKTVNNEISIYIENSKLIDQVSLKDFSTLLSNIDYVVSRDTNKENSYISIIHNKDTPRYAFRINSDEDEINIEISSKEGFKSSLYYLLECWGFKFLGYSDNWIELPNEITTIEENRVVTPSFERFTYFGTGGFGRFPNQYKMIKNFNRRNSLDLKTYGGHGYHGFGKVDENEIDKIIETFRNDYLLLREKDENVNLIISPPDGIGVEGKNSSIPEITNRITKYLWIGNQVAKALNKEFNDPNLTFGYYAYGNGKGNLTPPPFELEKNIIIEIIPYAFQTDYNTTLLQEKDVKAITAWQQWKKEFNQENELYIYDYWNISQWSASIPRDNMFTHIAKLNLWKNSGIKGGTMESTNTSALMNPHLWVAGNFAKDNSSIDDLYTIYFDSAFKEVSDEMQEFYQILSNWNGIFSLNPAINLLYGAHRNATSPIVKKRLVELMAYMHFVVLHYELVESMNTGSWIEKSRDYELWAKKVNNLGIIQTQATWYYNYGKNKSSGRVTKQLEGYEDENYDELESLIINLITQDKEKYNFGFEQNYYDLNYNNFELVEKSTYKTRAMGLDERFYIQAKQDLTLDILIQDIKEGALFEIKGNDGYYNSYVGLEDFTMNDQLTAGVKYEIWLGNRGHFTYATFNIAENIFYKDWIYTSQPNAYQYNTFWIYIPEEETQVVFRGWEEAEKDYFTDIVLEGTALDCEKELVMLNGKYPIYKIPTHTQEYDIRGKVVQIRSWVPNPRIFNFNTLISRREFRPLPNRQNAF